MQQSAYTSTSQQPRSIRHSACSRHISQWHQVPRQASGSASSTLLAAVPQPCSPVLPQRWIHPVHQSQSACCHSTCLHKQAAAQYSNGSRCVVAHAAPTHSAFAATSIAAAASASEGGATAIFAVLLGYCVLIGSCFRSLPQILKVLRSGTTEGLSLTSNAVELLCYTIILAYNMHHGYDFSTYGEIIACWLQDIIIVGLIFRYTNMSTGTVLAGSLVFALLCGALFYPGLCPVPLLSFLQLSTLFIMALGSRVPQIWLNIKRGDAGVLSLTTCLLNVAGNTVRTFTTLVLTQDMLLLGGCVTQGLLNGVLLWQVIQTRQKQGRLVKSAPPDDDTTGLQPQLA